MQALHRGGRGQFGVFELAQQFELAIGTTIAEVGLLLLQFGKQARGGTHGGDPSRVGPVVPFGMWGSGLGKWRGAATLTGRWKSCL